MSAADTDNLDNDLQHVTQQMADSNMTTARMYTTETETETQHTRSFGATGLYLHTQPGDQA